MQLSCAVENLLGHSPALLFPAPPLGSTALLRLRSLFAAGKEKHSLAGPPGVTPAGMVAQSQSLANGPEKTLGLWSQVAPPLTYGVVRCYL